VVELKSRNSTRLLSSTKRLNNFVFPSLFIVSAWARRVLLYEICMASLRRFEQFWFRTLALGLRVPGRIICWRCGSGFSRPTELHGWNGYEWRSHHGRNEGPSSA